MSRWGNDDPYYIDPKDETIQAQRAEIERLEHRLEMAEMQICDLQDDLRMIRSTSKTALEVIRTHRLKRMEVRGEIVNPHVLEHVPEPSPFPREAK